MTGNRLTDETICVHCLQKIVKQHITSPPTGLKGKTSQYTKHKTYTLIFQHICFLSIPYAFNLDSSWLWWWVELCCIVIHFDDDDDDDDDDDYDDDDDDDNNDDYDDDDNNDDDDDYDDDNDNDNDDDDYDDDDNDDDDDDDDDDDNHGNDCAADADGRGWMMPPNYDNIDGDFVLCSWLVRIREMI